VAPSALSCCSGHQGAGSLTQPNDFFVGGDPALKPINPIAFSQLWYTLASEGEAVRYMWRECQWIHVTVASVFSSMVVVEARELESCYDLLRGKLRGLWAEIRNDGEGREDGMSYTCDLGSKRNENSDHRSGSSWWKRRSISENSTDIATYYESIVHLIRVFERY